jgi:hypothetical protein
MKKIYLSNLLLLFLPFLSFAQFEGIVAYEVTYEAIDESKKEMISMLPKKSLLYVKGKRSLFEQEVAGGGKQAFCIDSERGSGVLIMQFLGQAYKVEMSRTEMETLKKAKEMEIIETDESEIIAGFRCHKALAISDSDTLNVSYTTQLKVDSNFPPFTNIDGIPLRYEIVRGGVKMTYTALDVKETAISEETFAIPSEINSMKFSDFARSFAITQ